MENYLITAIILCFYLRTALTEADLHQQNASQDQLNPLNDFEDADTSAKAQDKRTIFNTANYGWAKHVGIKSSGHKYVIGYTPVDLKYTPVIRPLRSSYVYGKPKVHFHVKKPAVQLRPVRPVVWKPAVHVAPAHHYHLAAHPVGVAHVDQVHLKPVPHVDHVHNVPVHVDHVHNVPVHTDHVHSHVHNVPVHVDHVHNVPVHTDHVHYQVQVPHAGHVHVDHIHSVPVGHVHPVPVGHAHPVPVGHVHPLQVQPVALPQPIVPVAPPPQFIPSPLFEVTKPELGVLPLGAAFPSPILKSIPHAHFAFRPALAPQPVVPAAVPLPQPVPVPRPAVVHQPQPLYPPGTVVEYHGATNFINQIPLPQIPVNAVRPGLPPHLHFQFLQTPQHVHPQPVPAVPQEQHDVQIPAPRPHFVQQPIDLPQFHQQLPLEEPSHFQHSHQANNNVFQQQLPVHTQQTQFQTDQSDQQFVSQDSGQRYQPDDQVSNQQFYQGALNQQQGHFEQLDNQEGGYVYQRPDVQFGQQSLQPGETDLQLPVQLPQHPGFTQNARQLQQSNAQESSQFHGVFRPSIQLEPPYKK